jgi:hypothetical protein
MNPEAPGRARPFDRPKGSSGIAARAGANYGRKVVNAKVRTAATALAVSPDPINNEG